MGLSFNPLVRGLAAGGLLFASWMVVASAATSCADDGSSGTTGERVTLGTRAELASPTQFTNSVDWEISLTRATISSGAIYYFSGSPIEEEARAPSPVPDSRLGALGWLVPGVAHAHPGHYQEGEARGEMLTATSFDLVAGPVELADGEGITGLVRSARFTWGTPPAGPEAGALGDAVVLVEGTATKGELVKTFRLEGTTDDVLDASDLPEIAGCTFEEVDLRANGIVTIHIDPRVWLDQAEFDTVPDSPDGKPVDVPSDDAASRAFVRGIKKASAFVFTYESNTGA
ncbi:MAG: hypothetical protein HOW73_51070 [Polyangiaceae bacterium]|nr:hypothetical protein [Polyangiaceae bacterium]